MAPPNHRNINRIRGWLRLGTPCAVILAALSLFAVPATATTVKADRTCTSPVPSSSPGAYQSTLILTEFTVLLPTADW